MILGLNIRMSLGGITHAPNDGNNIFLEDKIPMNPVFSTQVHYFLAF